MAEACERMLTDSKAVEKLAELKKQDKGLFNKIKQFITGFFNKIIERYKKLSPSSAEAKLVQEIEGMSEKLQKLFEDALIDAAETHRVVGAEKNTADSGVKYELKNYSEHQVNNWSNSKKIVIYQNDAQLSDFIDNAIKGNNLNQKMYFGIIGEDLSSRIKKDTSVDVKNYNVVLKASEVRKILLYSHGDIQKESMRGQRIVTKEDLMLIPLIITEPEYIRDAGVTDDNKPAISFEKTVKGKTTVITYVSDKHMDLSVQTMYAGKEKSLPTTADVKSSALTSETDSGTASNDSISNAFDSVNTKFQLKQADAEYMKAVKRNNVSEQERLVELAARGAGFDSPKLYHGTQKFGFTQFDLEKMDDGRSIFLTSSKELASTYSGVEGTRNIGDGSDVDINKISGKKIAEILDNGDDNVSFEYIDEKSYLKNLKPEFKKLDKIIKKYNLSDDIFRTSDFNMSRLNSLDFADYSFVEELKNKLRIKDILQTEEYKNGVVVKTDALGEQSYHTLEEAKSLVQRNMDKGNYSFYAKLGNSFVVDGNNASWKNIAYTADGVQKVGTTREISEYASEAGYDSVTFKNIVDRGDQNHKVRTDISADVYIIFDPNSVKSADPVTYDDNGNVIPLSERFDDTKSDIRFQRKSKSINTDYSDLSKLDEESLRVYNDRGWARGLFKSEDIVLLNQKVDKAKMQIYDGNTTRMSDGSLLCDINNKIVVVSMPSESYRVFAVAMFNASSESFIELVKEELIDENKYKGKEAFVEDCRTLEYVRGTSSFRIYESSDYSYNKGQHDRGERATLPDDWQNYGYTTGKQDRGGVSPKTQRKLPRIVFTFSIKHYAR